ncbi:MAG: cytochrome b N-terminal domain-containing protein [Thermomicrobiales bacterium]
MNILTRAWRAFDDRTGTSKLVGPIITHPVPQTGKIGWAYVFGSATLISFITLVATGTILATAYVPATGDAYSSLQFISNDTFGRILRGIHYFSASAMMICIGAHMIRVFLMGSYKFPREVNWLTGVVLFALTLAMAFTGQLLRWDQDGFWSLVVVAEQAGRLPLVGKGVAHFIFAGDTVSGATLSRFFAIHVFFIPALIFATVALHLYLVIHDGISEPPKAGDPVDPKTYRAKYDALLKRHGVPFWPDAAWRDAVFSVMIIVVIVLLAVTIGPKELGKQPDPSIIDAYPRPDWYFLWYFGVLALLPKGTESAVIVLAPVLLFVVLFGLPFASNHGERSPKRRPWSVAFVLIVLIMIGTLWQVAVRAPWSPQFDVQPLSAQVVGTTSGPIAQGAQLFNAKGCQYCHAVNGQGGNRGPDLTNVANRLPQEQITIRILNGGDNMPAYGGNLSPDELNAIIAFLKSRQSP